MEFVGDEIHEECSLSPGLTQAGSLMPVRPPTFRPKGQRTQQQAAAEYDARRGSARERGYTTRWDKAAAGYKRSHPLCIGCQALGLIVATEVVDHVIPHKGDQALFWDQNNWQSSCAPHHDVVKKKLEALYAQGKARAGDLRLDSTLAQEISRETIIR